MTFSSRPPFISRRHAVIVSDDENTRIVDWGSKNGVFVNTSRVKEQILRNGDIVTIGTADFKFEERRQKIVDAVHSDIGIAPICESNHGL